MSYAPMQSNQTPANQIATPNGKSLYRIKNQTRTKASRSRTPPKLNGEPPSWNGASDFPIIVHCHLCWDWVWQRPQQFLSRLSQNHRILFIETVRPEPNLVAPFAQFRAVDTFPNITVLRLQFPAWQWHDGPFIDQERRRLVQTALAGPLDGQFKNAVQWFYDPMAVNAFTGHLGEVATVYDCMDELSKFSGAPPQMLEREAALLEKADVVFTGGRKLYESKKRYHDNCHFYGCGVDVAHFGQAREEQTAVPPEVAHLTKPVLGFFGVVDERLDYELIAKLADADPNWSVAIVGPTAKVDERTFPRRPNLHWLGGRDYTQLPALCKGFDVCLMPFALNEATEFINPTKALEYMATGRNVVSSAVPDVVRNFGSVVKVASSHAEFISLCRQVISKPDQAAITRGLKMASENTWESIVSRLEGHVMDALSIKNKL